jgi:hypothetical protein
MRGELPDRPPIAIGRGYVTQFSTTSPVTRSKCLVLFVTNARSPTPRSSRARAGLHTIGAGFTNLATHAVNQRRSTEAVGVRRQ